MTHENESIRDGKAMLEAIVSSAKRNPLYAPGAEKASIRDKVVMAIFVCLIILMVLAFVMLGLFLIYLIYIFLKEGVPLIGCCGMRYR